MSGRVVDAKGEPLAGATVRTGAYPDTRRQSITGNDGRYTIVGCRPGNTVVVADSPGMAVEAKSVSIEPERKDVDFVLKPSKGIRVRFVDEAGNPLPGLKIFMENWRGKDEVYSKVSHVNKDVDENGFWEWKEAPLDEFSIQIISPLSEWDETPLYQFRHQMSDRMEYFLGPQKLLARQDEYLITVPKRSVSGTVTDAVTGEKIKSFRLAPGMSQQEERPKNPYWLRSEMRIGFDGTYRIPYTNHVCKKFFFRIDAAGYRSAVSRDIARDEGDVTLDFKLQPAETATTQILDAEGKPAADAVVVLATGHSTIFIRNGYLNDIDDGLEFKADDQGKVTFTPSSIEPFQLLILHDRGFARVALEKMAVPQQIKLTQWAVLEGKILNGQQPANAARIRLDAKGLDSRNGETGAGIRVEYTGITDSDGSFQFDRVVPGNNSVSRNGGGKKFVAVSGETKKLQVGGTGIPVVGRLLPPTGHDGSMDFEYANLILKSQKLNDDSKESDSSVFFNAVAKSDGSFRMDHIPPGDWVLTSSHQTMIGPDLIKLNSDPIEITIPPSDQAEKNIGDVIMKVDPQSKARRMLKQDTGQLRKKNNDLPKVVFNEQTSSNNENQAGGTKKQSNGSSASGVDGLIKKLPEDGTWASYDVETSITQADGRHNTTTGTLTVRSVGKVEIDGRSCRWLEFEHCWHQKKSETMESRFHCSITKIAIDETVFSKNSDPTKGIVAGYSGKTSSKQQREKWKYNNVHKVKPGVGSATGYGAVDHYIRQPFSHPTNIKDKTIVVGDKTFVCSGIEQSETSHKLGVNKNGVSTMAYRQWVNDKTPFGVVRYHYERLRMDGSMFNQRLTLKSTGKNAKSSIPEAK